MGKNVTLADVARDSSVSLSTASLVLREKPGIPAETRERVVAAARALGYRPKNAPLPAVGLRRGGKLHTLGLIVKSDAGGGPYANPFYSYVLAGIEDACRRKRTNLLYATVPVDEHNVVIDTPHLLLNDAADGLLLVGAFVDATLNSLLGQTALPVVLVDAYAGADQYDAVVSDNEHGAYQAVQHLIDQGHRHIALVGAGPAAYPSIRERRAGYLRALQAHGITAEYCADCELTGGEAETAIRGLLHDHPQITALFGCNDAVAIAAMQEVQRLGRRVPSDFSVIGFDDIDMARVVTPALTTMYVDKIGMGRQAVQLLGARVEFPAAERVTTVISPRLIERASVEPPRP